MLTTQEHIALLQILPITLTPHIIRMRIPVHLQTGKTKIQDALSHLANGKLTLGYLT